MPLTHYIVVRRDLPLGVIFASIVHAAGESFYQLGQFGLRSSVKEHAVSNGEVGGSIPSGGSTFNAAHTIAVVLGARNRHKLMRLERALIAASVPHVAIGETDGPFAGELMAIGLEPGDKTALAPHVREFHMFRELDLTVNVPGKEIAEHLVKEMRAQGER